MRMRQSSRDNLFRLIAGGCVALVMLLTVLAACPSLHAWMHGEKQLDDDDDCVVVLFIQGVSPALAAIVILVIALRVLMERLPAPPPLLLAPRHFRLPPGCGPPSS
jgi:hypothetical protein